MEFELSKDIVFFDLESTGTNPAYDRVVEFAGIKYRPSGGQERLVRRINPQCTIPAEAHSIHGISDADVADCPVFEDVAPELLRFLAGADLAGFGIARFDVPLLCQEFRRAGFAFDPADAAIIDAQKIFHMREPRTLSAALAFYCDDSLEQAHSAEADAEATARVLHGQLERYHDLPRDLHKLDEQINPERRDAVDSEGKIRWKENEAVINFGKKAGMSLRELAAKEPNYLRWILNKNFSAHVKQLARDALEGKFPRPPQRR